MPDSRTRFGAFIAPFHPVDTNPALALQRDLELVSFMDELGYDEAWIGEHHSAGYEIIASPEVFIAAAAERTKHIKLGTGVSSLPYHHPLMLADRINQLDYMTRGRVMFGVGPGALPSDAFMMGIDPLKQRDMMDEAIEVLVPLLRGETVTAKTDWFELREARLQLPPYTLPHVEICVAS
ncbi:MAG: LLM class flavin-dependent oxidoreductase, partial [Myxococcales bacterium]|nr:LLM class flavin-dependent oxidoreductase [Myxococcales bacterium]